MDICKDQCDKKDQPQIDRHIQHIISATVLLELYVISPVLSVLK
jgi:hypothetical protein